MVSALRWFNMIRRLGLAVLIVVATAASAAQSRSPGLFDLDRDREPMVLLESNWRFHPGDDARWADPGFDDSHWPVLAGEGGWSATHPGMSGFAWYRTRLLIPSGAPPQTLLVARAGIITNYQVFADGKPVDQCSWPAITEPVLRGQAFCPLTSSTEAHDRTLLLAIRVWHWPHWASYQPGGIVRHLRVGGAEQIRVFGQLTMWTLAWQAATKSDLLAILYGLAGLSALAFYLLRHREKQYLWFGIYAMLYCAADCYQTYTLFHVYGLDTADFFRNALYAFLDLASIAFYKAVLGGRRDWLYWTAVAGVAARIGVAIIALNEWISIALFNELTLVLSLPVSIWIVYLLVRRAIDGFPDARLLLTPAILGPLHAIALGVFWILEIMGWMKVPDWMDVTFKWPFPFNFGDLSDFIFLNAIVAILLLRFNRASTHGERLAAEMIAARAAQQVLVPEEIAPIAGFAIQSAYRPAGNLSGDFFQVLPDSRGGALIALGDVSGKGLKAAMTGTLAIGALRTMAASGLGPAALLSELNQQVLAAKQGGFITLICAVIAPDGAVTIANAGHLSPYYNGKEMGVEAGLPLGIVPGTTYPETRLQLAPGDTLTLLSDGVVEARSATGELFGFDRTEAISASTPNAIAEAAHQFGQDDDITVLSVTRIEKGVNTDAATVLLNLAPAITG
jgi:hypothetical protein